MKTLVIPRTTQTEQELMSIMYKWCVEQFGPVTDDQLGWSIDYTYSDSDEEVDFKFYNESYYTCFILQWNGINQHAD